MFSKMSISRMFSVLFVVMILVSSTAFPTNVRAASLTVNSLADTVAVDGNCTLREAIQNANNDAATNADCTTGSGADTITFSVSGTITLGTILPTIADAAGLALDGTGQAVTISGNNVSKIAVVPPSASLTLNHMTIANGYTSSHGGAISSSGTLVILNSVFSENNAYYFGGGIFNSGALTITNSVFSGNTASKGGGIYNDAGDLTITSSTFFNNSASGGEGGGINVFSGNLTITDSTFNQNSASLGSGGGIYNAVGTLTIMNSTFSENTTNYGEGGGIYNSYDLTIKSSTFTNNSSGSGGGILNSGAYFTVANSTFSGNNVSASGVNGGGILNEDYGLVVNSTFSGNSAPDGGGAIGSTNSHLTLRNTIVANSVSGGNCAGTITNGGSNLDDGVTCGWGSAFGSISDTNPDLGAPAGSPAYFPLNAGSPAIDKGDNPICAASPVNNQSQNGVTRPQGTHCDIGSYEYVDTSAPIIKSISRVNPNPTDRASVNFIVTFSKPVTGVDTSDFSLTLTGVTGTLVTAVSGSGATRTVTVKTGSGDGTIRLDVPISATITDLIGNPLDSLPFTGGQTYTVNKTLTFQSIAAQDGWILESTETSNVGGTMNATAATLSLGDNAVKKQYRSFLSFNTSGLPDNAVITKVTLKLKHNSVAPAGTTPITLLQGIFVDIRKGYFDTNLNLQLTDFQSPASKTVGPFTPALSAGWYTISLNNTTFPFINKLITFQSGLTQIRLRFKLDDNTNTVANMLNIVSGNHTTVAYRPQLIVEYYVP